MNDKRVGLSSIFALDITDPENPDLLWEFTDNDLGFTTSYPAIVRIGDKNQNGDWYVVLGSGPRDYEGDTPPSTGYIYVIDLKTGDLIRKISVGNHTYMGDCIAVDPDHDYTIDAIYCGTVKRQGSNVTGNMLRILTDEKGPNNWSITTLYNAGAPITASPELTFDEAGNLWCFFGTGKYFGEIDKTDASQQYLYGIKDTCWKYNDTDEEWRYDTTCTGSAITNIFDATNVKVTATPVDYMCMCEGGEIECCEYNTDGSCKTPAKDGSGGCNCGDKVVTEVDLNSVSVSGCGAYSDWDDCAEYIANDFDGWKIKLHTGSPAERVISKPAVVGQLAMFTTFIPNCDICGFGGDSSLFSLYYKAGIAYKEPAILLSTGFKNNQIQKSVSIGKGAPAIGESIVTKQVGDKLVTYIQLSTGQVVEVTQKGIFMPNRVQFWIEE